MLHHAQTNTMALTKALSFQKLANFFSNLILKNSKTPKKTLHDTSSCSPNFHLGFQKFQFLAQRQDLNDNVLIFNVENTLLKSSSLFPYFMLVAFEGGSLIRAFILLLLHPFITLFRENFALKVMVMICFFGINKDNFREGKAVLPKFFLEDVGMESFEVLKRGKRTVAISNLPQVMVESFLKDYLDIDFVVGKDLKVFCGYFVGIMEERRGLFQNINEFQILEMSSTAIGVGGFKRSFDDCQWFSYCKEIYLVSDQERRNWHQLPRHLYPNPLIFHDGRLAFRPTFLATLAMLIWLPLGVILGIIRIIIAIALPFEIAIPIMHFTGVQIRVSSQPKWKEINRKDKRMLYVCNHRTLLDPIAVSYGIRSPLTAVTYSLSRISEIISPIKTVRLTRNKEKDADLMHKLLSESDLIVCPEGTTCREPYLLRFSPLFAEMSQDIFPVAMNCTVSMFYGTTARGLKFLDPLFFLMNPRPSYSVRFLDVVRGCGEESGYDAENSRFKVANLVQNEIAKALGFTCTKLTRKDKYLILAGNEGIVQYGKRR
ncbi:hypothetical protein BUALT_Bualt11G0077200 [Buddleja alternifolia]|uniref:Phospholipid/glycerol acyltransferase domain-containing protein n=1 Tax=Buddleja alternifolia TaxID=168488 RepID=A0AAV6WUN7_9LAMI|nr:hypothetical protein BUALT_Bualt11G0077200 [Buddleja alternifolia]